MAPPPLAPPPPRASAKLLLLEDVPLAFGSSPGARDRLRAALASVAAASRFPAIVCLTETAASSLGDERSLGWRDALACLEDAGAAHIAVNPATKSELAKAVMRIAVAEGTPVTQAAAGALADSARGDIRAAVAALQMRLVGAASGSGAGGGGGRKRGRGAEKGAAAADKGAAAAWGARDDTLSLFHALGKLLYNKRVPPPAGDAAAPAAAPKPGAFPLAPPFRRAPAEVKDPEAVLAQAALTPAAALAFLHGVCELY
jgi:cell cycle checkpoint protein